MYVTLRMQKTKDLVNNPISDEAMELIGQRGTGKVFIGFEDYMTQVPMRRWLKAAGITKHISFHCTRHTFGTLQVEAGTPVYTVQHMLGHKNVETTQIYDTFTFGRCYGTAPVPVQILSCSYKLKV